MRIEYRIGNILSIYRLQPPFKLLSGFCLLNINKETVTCMHHINGQVLFHPFSVFVTYLVMSSDLPVLKKHHYKSAMHSDGKIIILFTDIFC